MNDFNQQYSKYLSIINDGIDNLFSSLEGQVSDKLLEAIRYAVVDGGKRIRPVTMLAVADYLGLEQSRVLNYAIALELIHSYSLVHDDLPAMDNDDYRRGKLSTHKKYGEDIGILVGDALLNLAIETCLSNNTWSIEDKNAVSVLFSLSGAKGMIKGQYLDITSAHVFNEQVLMEIHDNKTSKLLLASFIIPSILSGKKEYDKLYKLGQNLGLIFQIKDDILDVEGNALTLGKTPNKDLINGKLTFVSLYGLKVAKDKLDFHYNIANNMVKDLNCEFLQELCDYMYKRTK